jgi:hypothetical protein
VRSVRRGSFLVAFPTPETSTTPPAEHFMEWLLDADFDGLEGETVVP